MASSSAAMTLAPNDNVAVALRPLAAGETVVKYGCPIGRATSVIAAGAYVHTHNVASAYLPTYTLPA